MERLLGVALCFLVGCPDGGGAPAEIDANVITGKRVFVTAAQFTANFGGAAGADAECQDAATAAGRGGTWKAWVSSTTEDAIDRMADVGPWLDYNNQTVFADRASMASGPLWVINTSETGAYVDSAGTWTGTMQDGTLSTVNGNCLDWTNEEFGMFGGVGQLGIDGPGWTDAGASDCSSLWHLYCFEQ